MAKLDDVWVVQDPDGRVLVDTRDFVSAVACWGIVLGWPSVEEIEGAKRAGWQVFRAKVSIDPEAALFVPSVPTEPGDLDMFSEPLKPGT